MIVLKKLIKNQSGSPSIEYALLIFLIALALIGTLFGLGDSNLSNFGSVSESVDATINDGSEPKDQDIIFLETPSEEPDESDQVEIEKNEKP